MPTAEIAGQLNAEERRIITEAILDAPNKPAVVLEVGTWLGGGSTLHILRALEQNRTGHLWGIEADKSIYEQMIANLRAAAPEALSRFTPLFGLSQDVIPKWLSQMGMKFQVDIAFLDGGDNPLEQITEFRLLESQLPIGGIVMTHDAKLRKGKWLVPFVSALDNWQSQLHDVSPEGLFVARKIAPRPSRQSLRAAQSKLWRMRCQPAELAAAMLPAKICGLVLKLLPHRLSLKLGQGRVA